LLVGCRRQCSGEAEAIGHLDPFPGGWSERNESPPGHDRLSPVLVRVPLLGEPTQRHEDYTSSVIAKEVLPPPPLPSTAAVPLVTGIPAADISFPFPLRFVGLC